MGHTKVNHTKTAKSDTRPRPTTGVLGALVYVGMVIGTPIAGYYLTSKPQVGRAHSGPHRIALHAGATTRCKGSYQTE
jgi:hypothetical protein